MKVKSVRTIPMGTSKVLGLYPTVVQKVWDFSPSSRYQGGHEGGKHQGGLPPSTSMTNCSSVYQTAKTFGQKNRDNVYVLSRPVMPRKR